MVALLVDGLRWHATIAGHDFLTGADVASDAGREH